MNSRKCAFAIDENSFFWCLRVLFSEWVKKISFSVFFSDGLFRSRNFFTFVGLCLSDFSEFSDFHRIPVIFQNLWVIIFTNGVHE